MRWQWKLVRNLNWAVLSFATPRPSNFYRAAKVGNEKGLQTMRRATNAQVSTTWKKKKGAFSTAKSTRGGRRRKSKRRRRRKRKKRKTRKKIKKRRRRKTKRRKR